MRGCFRKRLTAMGHLHPYAASSASGCRAPTPDLPAPALSRKGSTLSGHSAPAHENETPETKKHKVSSTLFRDCSHGQARDDIPSEGKQ